MKTAQVFKSGFFSILLFIILISCNETKKVETETKIATSATMQELGQMNRDFAAALTAKDSVAAANVYHKNASLLPPNEHIIKGRAKIQSYWKGAIDANIIDASVKTIDAKSDGNLGYEIGEFQMRFLGPKGDTIVETGKYTEILERNAAGKWISTYGMWSTNE